MTKVILFVGKIWKSRNFLDGGTRILLYRLSRTFYRPLVAFRSLCPRFMAHTDRLVGLLHFGTWHTSSCYNALNYCRCVPEPCPEKFNSEEPLVLEATCDDCSGLEWSYTSESAKADTSDLEATEIEKSRHRREVKSHHEVFWRDGMEFDRRSSKYLLLRPDKLSYNNTYSFTLSGKKLSITVCLTVKRALKRAYATYSLLICGSLLWYWQLSCRSLSEYSLGR